MSFPLLCLGTVRATRFVFVLTTPTPGRHRRRCSFVALAHAARAFAARVRARSLTRASRSLVLVAAPVHAPGGGHSPTLVGSPNHRLALDQLSASSVRSRRARCVASTTPARSTLRYLVLCLRCRVRSPACGERPRSFRPATSTSGGPADVFSPSLQDAAGFRRADAKALGTSLCRVGDFSSQPHCDACCHFTRGTFHAFDSAARRGRSSSLGEATQSERRCAFTSTALCPLVIPTRLARRSAVRSLLRSSGSLRGLVTSSRKSVSLRSLPQRGTDVSGCEVRRALLRARALFPPFAHADTALSCCDPAAPAAAAQPSAEPPITHAGVAASSAHRHDTADTLPCVRQPCRRTRR